MNDGLKTGDAKDPGDFVWETDAAGRFSFASACGALGYSAETLIGARPSILLRGEITEQRMALFCGHEPIAGEETWLYAADGSDVCMRLSAKPVFNDDGRWSGMRGAGTNVTEIKLREALSDTAGDAASDVADRLIAADT